MNIYIIGSGLFGALVRDLFAYHGQSTIVIDNKIPLGGSAPAGCLLKPSWLSALGKQREPAMEVLDQLYGLRHMPLKIGPVKMDSIMHVSPDRILQPPDIEATVSELNPDTGTFRLHQSNGAVRVLSGLVIVAAGIWSQELLPEHFCDVDLRGLMGVSMRFRGTIDPARMRIWAPYKQSIAFQITPGQIWFGDGTAIKPENWSLSHEERSFKHAHQLDSRLDRQRVDSVRQGIRPYVPKHAGWCKRAGARCWVTTGGGKNGVTLAAAQARQLVQEILE